MLAGFVLSLALAWPAASQALDAETARLELEALCQAMPYRCPHGAAQTTAEDLRAQDARTMQEATLPDLRERRCIALVPVARVIRDKQQWRVPLTAVDVEQWQEWTHQCQPWHLWMDKPPRPPVISSTIECSTTSMPGRYHSTLTSTCTLY